MNWDSFRYFDRTQLIHKQLTTWLPREFRGLIFDHKRYNRHPIFVLVWFGVLHANLSNDMIVKRDYRIQEGPRLWYGAG